MVGTSEHYDGATLLGRSGWLYDAKDGSTTRLGLFGAGFVSSDGTQYRLLSPSPVPGCWWRSGSSRCARAGGHTGGGGGACC